ncbi:MAG: integrase, partial [Microbacterium sp.]
LVMKRKNFLLPCVKATSWTHTSAGRKKRVYDKPRTPYQRLLDTGTLDAAAAERLAAEHEKLNPAAITRRILRIQQQLIDLAAARTQGTRPAA